MFFSIHRDPLTVVVRKEKILLGVKDGDGIGQSLEEAHPVGTTLLKQLLLEEEVSFEVVYRKG